MPAPIISASELERFCYCPLSWWLSRGHEANSESLDQGERMHETLSTELETIVQVEKKALVWERAVLWFSLAATILALIGIFIFNKSISKDLIWVSSIPCIVWIGVILYLVYVSGNENIKNKLTLERAFALSSVLAVFIILNLIIIYDVPTEMAMVCMVLSLIWLIGTSIALFVSLSSQKESEIRKGEAHTRAKITYIGTDSSGLLRSEKFGLSGRPDYILQENGEVVPVEMKSGRMPKGPLFSHIVQLAAYCLILSEDPNNKVTRGILKYGTQEFDIDFDEGLKALVMCKLVEMRDALDKGEAHRNHNRPGKCRSCSRRDECPEKIG